MFTFWLGCPADHNRSYNIINMFCSLGFSLKVVANPPGQVLGSPTRDGLVPQNWESKILDQVNRFLASLALLNGNRRE
jgi:hypothetical protein